MRRIAILVGLIGSCAWTGIANADLAKEGNYDATLCFGGPLPAIAHSDKHVAGVLSLYAPMISNLPNGGLYHLNGIHCQGVWAVIEGLYQENGFCEVQDPQGDKIFGKYSRSGEKGLWQVMAGTGKYAGMTSNGEYHPVGQFAQQAQGTLQHCNRATGTYRLK
jgi:hypothetical protein